MDQHTGGKFSIHDLRHHKDNQLQSLELPVEYPNTKSKHGIKYTRNRERKCLFLQASVHNTLLYVRQKVTKVAH